MIYMDNGATTRPDPEVVHVMTDVMQSVFGNPSSLHGIGGQAERLLQEAREVVAKTLDIPGKTLIFTSGGTESNNLAIKGVALQYQQRGRHLITSEVEHASVYGVFQQLEKWGWKITYLPVDGQGRVQVEDVKESLTDETVLVSIMHVNNETGTIQPVDQIGQLLKKYPKTLFHVDGIQSFGKVPLSPAKMGIDLLSISGHKFHGPKGVGCLYVREGVSLSPLLVGGGQEMGLRSGTQNVPGITGFAKAALLADSRRVSVSSRLHRFKKEMITQLAEELHGMIVNGDVSEQGGAPHILSVSFPGLKSEVIVHALEQEGVVVSSKSACSSKGEKPSRILTAMGLNPREAVGTIRISMGSDTTEEDRRGCVAGLLKVIPKLQQVMKVDG
ncbi:cysteine desulfurase [Kroppenstedtia pulmonis]|uniref:Cysteine desulfurase n=1 Tax=Kroppenstedtia pulmonis TaxID=1380685 RepID=A0A7D4B2Z3_9BACL|nr:cysteine desulfurase family protein [Kroppenstedtia pulmonis]QKG84866.1 cysteine desulfurase [Kroppenstedtia pulmonis]